MSRRSHHMVQYCVFDVIYHKGKKVTHLPLVERKELLDAILEPTEAITKVLWMYGRGTDYFNLIKEHGLEGIVLKKADSKYQINKKSNDWLRVIHYQYADAVVTGIRKEEFIKKALDQGLITAEQAEEAKTVTDQIENELQQEEPSQGKLKQLASNLYSIGSKGLLSLTTNVITDPKWGEAVTAFLFTLI